MIASFLDMLQHDHLYQFSVLTAIAFSIAESHLRFQFSAKSVDRSETTALFFFAYTLILSVFVNVFYLSLFVIRLGSNKFIEKFYRTALPERTVDPKTSPKKENKIRMDDCVLTIILPEANSRHHLRDKDFQPEHFECSEQSRIPSKRYMQREWVFYQGMGYVYASIKLQISVHEISDYGDLTSLQSLNGAAAALYFDNIKFPEIPDHLYNAIPSSVVKANDYSNWHLNHINGKKIISYEVSDRENNRKTRYMHYALSSNHMLTLMVKTAYTDEKDLEKTNAFLSTFIDSWELIDLQNANLETNAPSVEAQAATPSITLSGPKFDEFDLNLPSEKEYRLILRQHARDEIEWIVFEQSIFYRGWFLHQMELVKEEYKQLRQAYIDRQFDICHAMCTL